MLRKTNMEEFNAAGAQRNRRGRKGGPLLKALRALKSGDVVAVGHEGYKCRSTGTHMYNCGIQMSINLINKGRRESLDPEQSGYRLQSIHPRNPDTGEFSGELIVAVVPVGNKTPGYDTNGNNRRH